MFLRSAMFLAGALVCACLAVPVSAVADTYVLADLNSEVRIDPASDAGMYSWTVDGVEHLGRQWFWCRIGSEGPEMPLNLLGAPAVSATPWALEARYQNATVAVTVRYMLTGGLEGSLTADVAESIRISNLGTTALDMHFFQYSDFNLEGTAEDDVIWLAGADHNTVRQAGVETAFSEVVVTPAPSHYEVGSAADLLAGLMDGSPTTAGNLGGPYAGDIGWIFQWDARIAPGRSFLISKDKMIDPVPEPITLVTVGLAVASVAMRLRRQLA